MMPKFNVRKYDVPDVACLPLSVELRFHFRHKGFRGFPPVWLGARVHADVDALNLALADTRPCLLQAGFARCDMPRGHLEKRGRRWFLGDVHFHRGALGSGIVSHEMLHAALHAGRAARLRLNRPEHEEALCVVHHRLVDAFWLWWEKV